MEVSSGEEFCPSPSEVKDKENEPAEGRTQCEDLHKLPNGYPNGIEAAVQKEYKHKDKYKEKHRDKHEEKHRDKHHNSSTGGSSSKDKDRHHSSKDKDKHRERHDKHHDKHHERDKSKDDKHREKHKHKEHKSSSHSSKDHSSSKDKDRDKHKSSSSSSHHKDKEKERSDKHSSGKDKDREKSTKSSSSTEIDKEKMKTKEKSKDKEHRQHGKDKVKEHKSHRVKEESVSPVKVKVKEEVTSPVKIREESVSPVKPKEEFSSPERLTYEAASPLKSSGENRTKTEPVESDEDLPLAQRTKMKRRVSDDEDDDVPLSKRKKTDISRAKKKSSTSDKAGKGKKRKAINSPSKIMLTPESPIKKGRKKREEEEQEIWKWWEEKKPEDGRKWKFLEHKGPVFAPPYERLPENVKFYYDGKHMKLSENTEEVATFYGKMLDHDYTTKEVFNKNFFKDWRKVMNEKERATITDLSKCDFNRMNDYFKLKSEERKNMSKEEKQQIKIQNDEIQKEYGVCSIDGHKEKIGNFKIEPPGLFRGRGQHPKMGMLKRRVMPEDVIINCSRDSVHPVPPPGHKWKEVKHDPNVTWLACWVENVQSQTKYVMLNPSSKLKGEKDWQKYETARKLVKRIDEIRSDYRVDWKSKEMRIRQRAVALYFIDKLALRAGNEKDEDQADTVGCCSLRVEHISLHEEKDGQEFVVVFDFLGKDSIRYYNEVPVEKRVFKNLELFMENKQPGDDLFDRLNTSILNKYLNELMEGLTAKVFRTFNASFTLQQQLEKLTNPNYSVAEMILAYNRANRAVAILCNHQRAVPKTHAKSMENLKKKMEEKEEKIREAEREYKEAKRDAKHGGAKDRILAEKKKKTLERLKEQYSKLEVQATDREENKEIALGTSKLNYLDPRISVAWVKKYNVPIEKIYNKTQRAKFRWAIDMAGPDFVF